jgi:acetamidase/formamidase
MVYIPVYVMDVDVTKIVNAEVSVNIPLGIFTADPPFRE